MRTLYLAVIDGMEDEADVGINELGFAIAMGEPALAVFTPKGALPETFSCMANMLGACGKPPEGRAYTELLACGLDMGDGDEAYRCTLVGVTQEGRYFIPDDGRADHAAKVLEKFGFIHIHSYKGLYVRPKSPIAFSCRPPHADRTGLLRNVLPVDPSLSALVTRAARETGGWTFVPWGRSERVLPKLHELEGVCVCHETVVKGLAMAAKMKIVTPPGCTGDVDTDLKSKLSAALNAGAGFVLVHVNGADEAAHRRDREGKAGFLRRVDAELIMPLFRALEGDDGLIVCSDHGTSSVTGGHMAGPVRVWRAGGQRGGLADGLRF